MSLAETMKKKAAQLRAQKSQGKQVSKIEPKKTGKKSTATKKGHDKQPRVQIKDKKGKVVTGRDNTFTCPECGNEITGPWSYKMHLVNQHDYSRKQAGLRESK